MAFRSFDSFGALREQIAPSRPGVSTGYEILRVAAEITADDGAVAARTCRAAVLDWARSHCGGELPPAAAEHGSFTFAKGSRQAEAVRVERPDTDLWAIRLSHPDDSPSGGNRIVEVGVEVPTGAVPDFRLRLLRDRDPSTPRFEPQVPEILEKIAALVELRQSDRPLSPDPALVDSEAAAERLCEFVLSPRRRQPVLVLSVPAGDESDPRPLLDPVRLARASLGLAVVVVLPAAYTWNLTRHFGDKLYSVYWGAVRLYMPGFRTDSEPRDHRLIMADRLEAPGGAERHGAELLRRIAQHSFRSHPSWSFADIRERARREAPAPEVGTAPAEKQPDATEQQPDAAPAVRPSPMAAPAAAPVAAPIAAPVAAPVPVPAAEPVAVQKPPPAPAAAEPVPVIAPARPVPEPALPAEPAAARAVAAPEAASPVPVPEPAVAVTETAAEPEAPIESPRGRVSWFRSRVRLLRRLFSRAADPFADDPVRARLARDRAALRSRVDELTAAGEAAAQALTKSDEEKDYYLSEYEQAEERAQEAERLRKEADIPARVEQLTEQLRRHGHTAHPDGWKDMRRWCEEEFGDCIELRPGAVQGIKKAEFGDLWLAAECIGWLAGAYRDARIRPPGQEPEIKKDVDSRLDDGPAGKGVRFPDWDAVPRHERRNISRGTNRERKHCLRIYYYWDADQQKVVIVSMPHHAHTRMS